MINFHPVSTQNQTQLLALLEDNPMQGWVSTMMTRQPNYLQGKDYFGEEQAFLAEDEGQTVGCYQLTTQQGFVNGQLTTLGYLNSLRVNTAYRHKIGVLKAGFRHLQQHFDLPTYCYTSIVSDNRVARRLLEKRINGLPNYHYVGELCTLVIAKRKAKKSGLWQHITATKEWLAFYNQQANQYQLAPYLSEQWLAKSQLIPLGYINNNQLQACTVLWQQQAFKQIKVAHYHPLIALLRPLYNGYNYFAKRPCLPKVNHVLPQSFLAFLHTTDQQLLIPLIADALYHCQTPLLTLSLMMDNPLLLQIIQTFKPFVYKTRIYRVDFVEPPLWQPNPLNLEAAIL